MASQKETSNIVFLLLGVGSLGLLAATMAKGKEDDGSGGMAGVQVLEGTATGGDGNAYEWIVETAAPGSAESHIGKARQPGFGTWDMPETIVAMGSSPAVTQGLIIEYLSALA